MNESTIRTIALAVTFISIAALSRWKTDRTQHSIVVTGDTDAAAFEENNRRKIIYDSMINQVLQMRERATSKNNYCMLVQRYILNATNYANLYLESGNTKYISKFNQELQTAAVFL